MDSFNDLQEIWRTADMTALPGAGEMTQAIRKYSRRMLFKKVVLVMLGLILAAGMVGVLFLYKSTMLTTRIGEACIIAACLVFVKANIGSVARAYRLKDYSNKDFILYLERLRINRLRYYRRTQVLGLSLSSLGLALYIFEPFHRDAPLCLVSYSVLAVYILFMWLVIRPRAFRRQAQKLERTINEMQRLADQL